MGGLNATGCPSYTKTSDLWENSAPQIDQYGTPGEPAFQTIGGISAVHQAGTDDEPESMTFDLGDGLQGTIHETSEDGRIKAGSSFVVRAADGSTTSFMVGAEGFEARDEEATRMLESHYDHARIKLGNGVTIETGAFGRDWDKLSLSFMGLKAPGASPGSAEDQATLNVDVNFDPKYGTQVVQYTTTNSIDHGNYRVEHHQELRTTLRPDSNTTPQLTKRESWAPAGYLLSELDPITGRLSGGYQGCKWAPMP